MHSVESVEAEQRRGEVAGSGSLSDLSSQLMSKLQVASSSTHKPQPTSQNQAVTLLSPQVLKSELCWIEWILLRCLQILHPPHLSPLWPVTGATSPSTSLKNNCQIIEKQFRASSSPGHHQQAAYQNQMAPLPYHNTLNPAQMVEVSLFK